MRLTTLLLALLFLPFGQFLVAQSSYDVRPIATDLEIPWEIQWGSNDMIWTTERKGIVSMINPETGEKHVLLDFRDSTFAVAEPGMLGFDFHPDFPDTPYIYIAICYGFSSPDYRVVKRFTFDTENYERDTLVDSHEIFREPMITYTHQGCRIRVGPDRKLYVSVGENGEKEERAQSDTTTLGKILRMNLDGSVPDDNPVPGQLMWTKGHRNPQGLVFTSNNTLFSAEHGNSIEDEVNRIEKGRNYGWPYVEGFCDEPYEMDFCDTADMMAPVFSSGRDITYAMAGLDYYDGDRFPELKNSLLLANLRSSSLWQLDLSEDQKTVVWSTNHLMYGIGRIRDIAISPDGRIFVCTSNRQPLAAKPFRFEGDDKIYELVTPDPEAKASISCPDTVWVNGPAGETTLYDVAVTNTGDAPTTILDVFRVIDDVPIAHAHWKMPFVVFPGVSYDVICRYYPGVDGSHIGHMRFITDNDGTADFIVIASTVVGVEEELEIPDAWAISPNPSSGPLTICPPPSAGQTILSIYDVAGQLVWQTDATGLECVTWPGTSQNGQSISSGRYTLRVMTSGKQIFTPFIRLE